MKYLMFVLIVLLSFPVAAQSDPCDFSPHNPLWWDGDPTNDPNTCFCGQNCLNCDPFVQAAGWVQGWHTARCFSALPFDSNSVDNGHCRSNAAAGGGGATNGGRPSACFDDPTTLPVSEYEPGGICYVEVEN